MNATNFWPLDSKRDYPPPNSVVMTRNYRTPNLHVPVLDHEPPVKLGWNDKSSPVSEQPLDWRKSA